MVGIAVKMLIMGRTGEGVSLGRSRALVRLVKVLQWTGGTEVGCIEGAGVA